MSDLSDLVHARFPRLIEDAREAIRLAELPPCARCGTAGGVAYRGGQRPARWSGARFGIAGDLCYRCYRALQERERRRRR